MEKKKPLGRASFESLDPAGASVPPLTTHPNSPVPFPKGLQIDGTIHYPVALQEARRSGPPEAWPIRVP